MSGDEGFWGDLLAHIRGGSLVPVVGPDVCVINNAGSDQTLTTLIGQRLTEQYQLTTVPKVCSMVDAVEAIMRERGREEAGPRLYRVINDIINEVSPVPGQALRDLAAIEDLRLFVSTTPDRLLAQALNDIRFQGQPLTREIPFSIVESTGGQASNVVEGNSDDTVVLSLFGRAASVPQFAIHDEDQLEWLHALLSDGASLPDWLAAELRKQPLLFIGCEIPDWIGRILLRMESLDRLSSPQNKQFFLVYSPTDSEPSLSEFFSTYCMKTQVQQLQMEPTAFVEELHQRWEKTHVRRPAVPIVSSNAQAASRPEIFISYMREDVDAARRLSQAISEIGGPGVVWLDEQRLSPGKDWEEEILTAIRGTVRMFVPLISSNTKLAEESYVFKEWNEAADRSRSIRRRRFIVPVVIDADYQGDPTPYDLPDAFTKVQIGRAPNGEPDEKLLASLEEEIKNMRRPGGAV